MTTRPQRLARPADYGALLKRDLPPARKQQPRQQSDADPAYLAMVRQCPCLRCGQDPAGEAAHVRLNSATHGKFGAKGKKPSDKWALPLCGGPHGCHAEQHKIGELPFWYAIDQSPFLICQKLYAARGDLITMRMVVTAERRDR